ncbi:hypothetical protein STAR110904_07725 [Staphylococcus argensis]
MPQPLVIGLLRYLRNGYLITMIKIDDVSHHIKIPITIKLMKGSVCSLLNFKFIYYYTLSFKKCIVYNTINHDIYN